MKAWVLRGYGSPLALETVPDPAPGPTDVVIRVRRCGVCSTDLKIASGKLAHVITLPHVPGHEVAGEVVALGSEVRGLSVGDRGTVFHYQSCRDCPACRTGRENVCHHIRRLGFELPGGFAEYVRAPAYNFCRSPPGVPFEQLAILPDAVLTAFHSVATLGAVRAGQKVLVLGVGGLGVHAVQFARLLGASVAVADARPRALEVARQLGAEQVVDPTSGDLATALAGWTGGAGVDVAVEGTGDAAVFRAALAALAPGGRLVIMGYDPLAPYPLDSMAMHYQEWTIVGSRVGTKQELLDVIDLLSRERFQPLVAQELPMREANRALDAVRAGAVVGRIVLSADGGWA